MQPAWVQALHGVRREVLRLQYASFVQVVQGRVQVPCTKELVHDKKEPVHGTKELVRGKKELVHGTKELVNGTSLKTTTHPQSRVPHSDTQTS